MSPPLSHPTLFSRFLARPASFHLSWMFPYIYFTLLLFHVACYLVAVLGARVQSYSTFLSTPRRIMYGRGYIVGLRPEVFVYLIKARSKWNMLYSLPPLRPPNPSSARRFDMSDYCFNFFVGIRYSVYMAPTLPPPLRRPCRSCQRSKISLSQDFYSTTVNKK